MADYFKSTGKIRAEVRSDYAYVRNLEGKGGVIDASLNQESFKSVSACIQAIEEESFSEVWDKLNSIKGVRFEFSRN